MNFDVKIHKLIDNGKPLKATASVTIDNAYALHNVRVIETDKGAFMGMPFETYTDKDGNEVRKDIFHPISSEARKALEEAVITAYNEKVKEQA